ncbi:MAG: wax ester/triacylglycerol synthase family O-acyltransferase [Actinobacteria bacterium]|nr:MAG: wax ester/triacylglycerol synthase family O-acyltransferase [Actinomycetota bacterium]
MERMSTLDAGFYFLENENTPMHVGSVSVFEGPAPSYGDVVRLLVSKLPKVPRYRQRVRAVPLHIGRPAWVDDEHFEILYHVRHTAVPRPGGAEQLRNLAGRVFAQRLDMDKPLWELWFVEGLDDDRWAVISKVHHCMIDGVAGWDLAALLLDTSPDAEHPPTPDGWSPRPAPSTPRLWLEGLRDAFGAPLQQLGRVPELARSALNPGRLLAFSRGLPGTARSLGGATARSLNGSRGPHRRWEWTQASLDEVKQIRTALGGTVNDVVLAAVTRGFRDLLASRGELAEGQLVRSLVPVSVRGKQEQGVLNNRVSALLVNLPVGESDPQRRLARLREQMDNLKETRQAVGAQALSELAGFAAPTLLALGSRVAYRVPQPVTQTVTTNVPGPRFPLFMLGRRMTEIRPYIPIAANIRTAVGILSYLDQLNFGVTGDFDAVPDVGVLAGGIRAGVDELLVVAGKSAPAPANAAVVKDAVVKDAVTKKAVAKKVVAKKAARKTAVTPPAGSPGPRES